MHLHQMQALREDQDRDRDTGDVTNSARKAPWGDAMKAGKAKALVIQSCSAQ